MQRSKMSRFVRAATVGCVVLSTIGALGGAWLGVLYQRHVVLDPGPELAPEAVWSVVADESPVFFQDRVTRVGVFFDDEHRAFVGWESLPVAWVAAIVAAEDDTFWSHPGVDPVHVARALRDNLRSGGLVAGGSTLTQQTAKNLFYRPDRSLRAKLEEALNALRLEAHFDKAQILTFYANQFHVVGNGRGIGIGARHFFDRDVNELGLLECAFLAGMVKAPSSYDPFRADPAARAAAEARAMQRTRYVLRRVAEEPAEKLVGPRDLPGGAGAYTKRLAEVRDLQAEARRLLDQGFELPFRKGTFRYESSSLLDEVGRRLAQPPFAEVLAAAGVQDPARAGLQVVTTLDANVQRMASWALWHHLTEVGVMLEGLGPDAFRRPDGELAPQGLVRTPTVGEFRVGRVVEHVVVASDTELVVDLSGVSCRVDGAAIRRVADAVKRGVSRSSGARSGSKERAAIVAALPVGANVWASVREVTGEGLHCDLEARPELQGAIVVLEEGRLRAMVGGNDSRDFNRATALRQLGSTWKPLVFHAALELGWRPDDLLDNRRQSFAFSTTDYAPRADHEAAPEVTLAEACARSENLASVWLAYHLMDRLDEARLAELVGLLGLARRPEEDESAYALRIQKEGVLPTPARVREALFLGARSDVVRARPEDAVGLLSIGFGWGRDAGSSGDASSTLWSHVRARGEACRLSYEEAELALSLRMPPIVAGERLGWRRGPRGIEVACGEVPEGFGPYLGEWLLEGLPLPAAEELRLNGRVRLGAVEALASAFDRRVLDREMLGPDASGLYAPEVLYHHQDFRVLLGLRYLARLARQYGVRTEIQEVLSLPLGASEITLEEAARLYEGLITGHSVRFPGWTLTGGAVAPPEGGTLLVSEIRDVDGRKLYWADRTQDRVVRDDTAAMTVDLLRLVVEEGTARRARGTVTLPGAKSTALPIVGKTGTTNSFRNAAFVGAVPRVEGGAVVGQYVVAVYVGYDDNRPLQRGGLSLAGASGALPPWLATVQALAGAGKLGEGEPGPEGWTWPQAAGLVRVPMGGGDVTTVEGAPGATVLTRPPALVLPELPLEWLAAPEAPVRVSPEAPPEVDDRWLHRAEE